MEISISMILITVYAIVKLIFNLRKRNIINWSVWVNGILIGLISVYWVMLLMEKIHSN